jgi:cytochrome c oxidase assembly protein subunit 15
MLFILGTKIILDVSNVVFSLSIAVAVMHNTVTACLMLVLVSIQFQVYRKT